MRPIQTQKGPGTEIPGPLCWSHSPITVTSSGFKPLGATPFGRDGASLGSTVRTKTDSDRGILGELEQPLWKRIGVGRRRGPDWNHADLDRRLHRKERGVRNQGAPGLRAQSKATQLGLGRNQGRIPFRPGDRGDVEGKRHHPKSDKRQGVRPCQSGRRTPWQGLATPPGHRLRGFLATDPRHHTGGKITEIARRRNLVTLQPEQLLDLFLFVVVHVFQNRIQTQPTKSESHACSCCLA